MSSEYFIEKRRLPVDIDLLSGERLSGDLFVQTSWRGPSVLEDAPEYMNAAEAFFPLQLPGGGVRLIARQHVSVLRTSLPAPPEPDNGLLGKPAVVELLLSNGKTVRGTIYIEAIEPGLRVLDHLNRQREPFLTVRDREGEHVVNRNHVVSVTEFDNGAD